jgi:hypothetical protein
VGFDTLDPNGLNGPMSLSLCFAYVKSVSFWR